MIELEGMMSLRKSELSTLKSTLEKQMGQRGVSQAHEAQLQMEMNAQRQSYEDQIRKLSEHMVTLTAENQSIQAENKSIQVSRKKFVSEYVAASSCA